MPAWPAYAAFLADGFGVRRESALTRTEMESGPPKQARTRSRTMVERSGSVLLRSKTDYIAFMDWIETDLDGGSAWFDWVDPLSQSTRQARLLATPFEAQAVRGLNLWRLPITLETWG